MIDFTIATPAERKRVYDAIARSLGDDQFFTSKELDVLPRILAPFEQVLSFSSGLMEGNTWLIVLTDARVLFVDKGLVFGLKQTSMELDNIVTIEGDTGLFFGTIRVSTAAGPREIRNVAKKTVNAFINKVREAMSARRRGERLLSPGSDAIADDQAVPASPAPTPSPTPIPAPTPPPASTPAPISQPTPGHGGTPVNMQRLDRLLRAGAIDQEEYDRQRRSLS